MNETGRHNNYGYTPSPWHEARKDLLVLLREREWELTEEELGRGWSLYGPEDPADHFCPPWHRYAGEYCCFLRDYAASLLEAMSRSKNNWAELARKVAANG